MLLSALSEWCASAVVVAASRQSAGPGWSSCPRSGERGYGASSGLGVEDVEDVEGVEGVEGVGVAWIMHQPLGASPRLAPIPKKPTLARSG